MGLNMQDVIVYMLGAAAFVYIAYRVRGLLVKGDEEPKCKACAVKELQKSGERSLG